MSKTNQLTVAKAIQNNYLFVLLPSIMLVLLPFVIGFQLLDIVEGESAFRSVNLVPFFVMILGLPLAIFISSILYTNWFVRSFLSVDHPALLYKQGVFRKIVTEKGSPYNRMHVMIGVTRADYDQAWTRIKQLGDQRDLKEMLPPGRELIIKGSRTEFYFYIGWTVLIVSACILMIATNLDNTRMLVLASLTIAVVLFYARKSLGLYRNMGKTFLIFTPKGLGIEGQLIPWSDILSFKVIQQTKYKTQLEVVAFKTTQVNTYQTMINDLEVSPQRINDMLIIYIDVYSDRADKPGSANSL